MREKRLGTILVVRQTSNPVLEAAGAAVGELIEVVGALERECGCRPERVAGTEPVRLASRPVGGDAIRVEGVL